MSLLSVRDLRVAFPTNDGLVGAVNGVSFDLNPGETLAIVGESGSGKSVTSLAVMGLHNRKTTRMSGEIRLEHNGKSIELLTASDATLRSLRGSAMSMIFQDPMTSLHPYYSIGQQLAETYRVHKRGNRKQALARAIELLDLVGIPEPQKRVSEYPHQFSGGMRQRVMIAMALMNNPTLLIADEPTTALDVTVQAQILALLRSVQQEFNTAIVLITHDLGIVAQVADRVQVMYAGSVVETGSADDVFYRSRMPYTSGLLSSMPSTGARSAERLTAIPGQPPSLINLPEGCAFRPRCPLADSVGAPCAAALPELALVGDQHFARCHADLQLRVDLAERALGGSR